MPGRNKQGKGGAGRGEYWDRQTQSGFSHHQCFLGTQARSSHTGGVSENLERLVGLLDILTGNNGRAEVINGFGFKRERRQA